MPNPGSPEQMRQMQQDMPQMPKGTMMGMLVVLLIMMIVMQFREAIGKALNVVFQYIDFGGEYPVLTLVISGVIMITISTVIRAYMSDPIGPAKSQHIQSEFSKEMRQARLENNLYKMKKLQEAQPKIMAASMNQQTTMMKTMPITMIVILPVYAWVWYFINDTMGGADMSIWINMPWGFADLNSTIWFMPVWIVIYTLISLPIGQLENKLVNYIFLKKRLEEINKGVQ